MPKASKRIPGDIRALLENLPWLPDLSADTLYERLHDDHDGTRTGKLMIQIGRDGDAWVSTDKHRGAPLRFRTTFGGGNSVRVRNALVLLALAMKLDEDERPDHS
jgi:hypothetical protein